MSYAPQPGDIGLTQIDGHVGRAIRLGQLLNGDGFADYEHAFVVVDTAGSHFPDEAVTIIEAEPGGARFAPFGQYAGRDVVYLRCPDRHRLTVARAVRDLVGTPYSFADYASLAARRLHIPVPHLRSYIADSGHMICSQLADEAAARGGWHLFDDGRWPGDVTPGDLYQLVRQQQPAREM